MFEVITLLVDIKSQPNSQMDYLTFGFITLLALRFSNADGGLTKKSGTIIIAGGGGHPAPYPVPVPIPIPVHHGYQQGYQTPQHYSHHPIQPYAHGYGQHYDHHIPAQSTHQQYAHPNLIVLPM